MPAFSGDTVYRMNTAKYYSRIASEPNQKFGKPSHHARLKLQYLNRGWQMSLTQHDELLLNPHSISKDILNAADAYLKAAEGDTPNSDYALRSAQLYEQYRQSESIKFDEDDSISNRIDAAQAFGLAGVQKNLPDYCQKAVLIWDEIFLNQTFLESYLDLPNPGRYRSIMSLSNKKRNKLFRSSAEAYRCAGNNDRADELLLQLLQEDAENDAT
jgi:hypothetical protein